MSRTERHKDTSGRWYGENTTGRDKKPANKPNSDFKKLRRKSRRSKANQAIRNGHEPLQERKNDVWDWN